MPATRWTDLPALVRQRIERTIGDVQSAVQVDAGRNHQIGVVVRTDNGLYFVKGVRDGDAAAVRHQTYEAMVNVHVMAVTAPLVFHIDAAGWNVLGFEGLVGYRHADFTAGSSDPASIAETLQALAELPPPPDGLQLKTADRWRPWAGDDSHHLAGTTLAHTDLHRLNVLIDDDRCLFVDWAWPTLAAPWVDTATVGLHLIEGGWHPKEVEVWCESVPAFASASDEALDVFARTSRELWREVAVGIDDPWKAAMARAAERWCEHRGLSWNPHR